MIKLALLCKHWFLILGEGEVGLVVLLTMIKLALLWKCWFMGEGEVGLVVLLTMIKLASLCKHWFLGESEVGLVGLLVMIMLAYSDLVLGPGFSMITASCCLLYFGNIGLWVMGKLALLVH